MRNYQLRKANNELTVKKNFGGGRIISVCVCVCRGGGGGWDSIYVYTPLFSRFWCYFTNFSEF